SLVSSLLLSGATMSQQSSLTQSAHSVRQVLTAYRLWAHLFCRCSLFDRFFSGLFALSIGFVQEPIDDARTALLFDPSLLRFLLFGEELVISFPARWVPVHNRTGGNAVR